MPFILDQDYRGHFKHSALDIVSKDVAQNRFPTHARRSYVDENFTFAVVDIFGAATKMKEISGHRPTLSLPLSGTVTLTKFGRR